MMDAAGLNPNAAEIAAGLPGPVPAALAHGPAAGDAFSAEGNQQA